MTAQPGMSRVGRGGWLVGLFAWCWAASGDAQAARTVVWLSAPSIERDPVAEAQRIHRERALRLELQARDLLLLEGEPAAAPEPDVPATLATAGESATVLLERSGAAAVLWLESDEANAVTWLMVKSRGASAPVKTPMPYPSDVIESQLFALAAASLLDQVLSTPEPATQPEPLAPNPFVGTPVAAAATTLPQPVVAAPIVAPVSARPRKPIAPLPERYVFVNVGIVAAYADLHSGMEASSTPDFDEVFSSYEMANGETGYLYNDGSPYIPDADTVDDYGSITPVCAADGTATGPGDPASKYCARVESPGLVAVPAVRFALGWWVWPDISLAAVYQLHFTTTADRPFGDQSFGAELQYLAIGEHSEGFGASLLGGAFIGRYETPADSGSGSYVNALSGPLGINAGFTMRYALSSPLAFVLAQHVGLRFPAVQVEIDVALMTEVGF